MPRKQEESMLEEFFRELGPFLRNQPFWVGPVIAGIVFFLFAGFLPGIVMACGQGPIPTIFAKVFVTIAPFIAGLCLFIWIIEEVKKHSRGSKLNSQSGLGSLRNLTWQEFEELVGEAFRRKGYYVEETATGADGGVDLILTSNAETVLVQCKQWRTQSVGVKVIRELYGVMKDQDAAKGIVVTVGHFTKEASSFASGKSITLMNGDDLWNLVKDVQVNKNSSINTTTSEVPDSGILVPQPTASANESRIPDCPNCGAPMVLRTARRGPTAGKQFYGCSNYPNCRGTRNFNTND